MLRVKGLEQEQNLVNKAYLFACEAHKNQTDKAGKPYIGHPVKVASMVEGETRKAAALLHDTVEDTSAEISDIEYYFGEKIAGIVNVLTRKKGKTYMEYIEDIKRYPDPEAKDIKIADLTHNMDLSRLQQITEKDSKRREKYKRAMDFLMKSEEDVFSSFED